ncbi:hypothetical protein ACGFW5_21020 [Streptomyces sp. NPDC048416]|uniref:hypothetical protein n=1 Tax=Streptomyces sp. NPDC048416 TaxID=3365546 RepID=UPI00371D26CD
MNLDEIVGEYQTLVLEGCDGVGESTLGERLSTDQDFAVLHSSKTPDHLDLGTRYKNILVGPGGSSSTGVSSVSSSTAPSTGAGPGSTGARRSTWPRTSSSVPACSST